MCDNDRMVASDEADVLAQAEQAMRQAQRGSCPSPTLVACCDRHLGIEMVRAVCWLLVEVGTASANINSFEFRRCPKLGCKRCYEPEMYGYFEFGGEMGSRIQPNETLQGRCSRHAEQPFLYVGRVERNRQFLCPFSDCDEVGDVVATDVADERIVGSDGRSEERRVGEGGRC